MTRCNNRSGRHNGALRTIAAAMLAMLVMACSSLGSAGPGTGAVRSAGGQPLGDSTIAVVELDQAATRRIAALHQSRSFSEVFGDARHSPSLIQRGDTISVNIWEAPPAVLFGASEAGSASGANTVAQGAAIPDQQVDDSGAVTVPFVGRLTVAGRAPAQVQQDIIRSLRGRAHDPQALVRIVGNQTSNVTILGEVAASRRVPLTARGERLLDVLAQAGGPKSDVGKTTVRMARGNIAATMPLDAVILDPAQNITLRSDDVITILHQPFSFTALGAVQRNAEVPFEGSGLTLAEALGRIGGLRDDRADIKGVFVFRFEEASALDPALANGAPHTADGRVAVIYRLDLSNAASLFVAREFAMRDKDMLYVSSAPGADLQKFLSTVSNVALSTLAIGNSL